MKLKILCIHGYRGNGTAFRERTGSFRKIVKKHAEFVFITAPNIIPPKPESDELPEGATAGATDVDERGWWFSTEDSQYHANELTTCVKGYDESLEVIRQAFREQGPFDGVLGFSQGACMVTLLCGLQQKHKDPEIKFDFAILVAGFRSRSWPHDELYSEIFTLPTLHVFGQTDKVIERVMSFALLEYFTEPVILEHPGGHFIPASAPQKAAYQNFLDDMIKRKTDNLVEAVEPT